MYQPLPQQRKRAQELIIARERDVQVAAAKRAAESARRREALDEERALESARRANQWMKASDASRKQEARSFLQDAIEEQNKWKQQR